MDILSRIVILLARVLLGFDTIQAALLRLIEAMDATAIETTPKLIQGAVLNTQLAVQHPTYGLSALHDQLAEIRAYITTQDSGLLAAIAALPAGSDIVIPAPDDNAAGVWGWTLSNALAPTLTADQAVTVAAMDAIQRGQTGAWKSIGDPNFHTEQQAAPYYTASAWYNTPKPDYSDVLPGDTVLSWLQRTELVRAPWELDPDTGLAISYAVLAGENFYRTVCDLRDFDLPRAPAGAGAPVWPGLAAVTLGTPVALSSDLTIAGPLDGLIVSITTPPTGLGKFAFGGFSAYYKVGEVAFVSDNGEAEPWQYLAFDQALYCPKAMRRAASASLRVLAGAAGTATPWLVT